MELKYCCLGECVQAHACSNRTFMELKYEILSALTRCSFERSNRTFMELKLHKPI